MKRPDTCLVGLHPSGYENSEDRVVLVSIACVNVITLILTT